MAFIMEPTVILNNGGYPVAPLTTPEMVRFNDGAKLTEYIQNTNLLDNSYFVRPINQRGEASKTEGGGGDSYFIDRWYVMGVPQISNSGTATIVNDGIKLNPATMLTQALEFPISGDTTCSLGVVSGSAYATYYEINGTQRFQIQNASTTDPCVISWAKLERGRTATPYVEKSRSAEYMECLRYFQWVARPNKDFAIPCSFSTTLADIDYRCIIPMRVAPSIVLGYASGYGRVVFQSASGAVAGVKAISNIRVAISDVDRVVLAADYDASISISTFVQATYDTYGGASVALSADL